MRTTDGLPLSVLSVGGTLLRWVLAEGRGCTSPCVGYPLLTQPGDVGPYCLSTLTHTSMHALSRGCTAVGKWYM